MLTYRCICMLMVTDGGERTELEDKPIMHTAARFQRSSRKTKTTSYGMGQVVDETAMIRQTCYETYFTGDAVSINSCTTDRNTFRHGETTVGRWWIVSAAPRRKTDRRLGQKTRKRGVVGYGFSTAVDAVITLRRSFFFPRGFFYTLLVNRFSRIKRRV